MTFSGGIFIREKCGIFYNNFTKVCPVHNKSPDSKVHGANMGPIWGWQDLAGPHVGPMNLAIWDYWFGLWLGDPLLLEPAMTQINQFQEA